VNGGVKDLELVRVSDETGIVEMGQGPLSLSQSRGAPDEQDSKVLSEGQGIAITWERMGMQRGLGGVCANLDNIANGLAADAERLAGRKEGAVLSDATGTDWGLGQKEVGLPGVLKVVFSKDAGGMEDVMDDCNVGVDDGAVEDRVENSWVCKKKETQFLLE
jgi:hypothetical protein